MNTVSVIDTTTNTVIDTYYSRILAGSNNVGIAYDPVNHRMYVANFGNDNFGGTVSVINLC